MKNPFNSILFLLAIFGLICSCDSNYGEVSSRENVDVYYLKPITKKQADKLADFWQKLELSKDKKQYIQLSKPADVIHLKLIANDSIFLNDIPFEIQIELFKLDSLLNKVVFPNQEVELIISDKTFTKSKRLN